MADIQAEPLERVAGREKTAGNKIYKWVKNIDNEAKTYGHPVCFNFSNGVDYEIDQPATAFLNRFAGTPRDPDLPNNTNYSIGVDEWGWIQIEGPAEVYTKGNVDAVVAGMPLKCVDSTNYMVKDVAADGTPANYVKRVDALAGNTAANALTAVRLIAG